MYDFGRVLHGTATVGRGLHQRGYAEVLLLAVSPFAVIGAVLIGSDQHRRSRNSPVARRAGGESTQRRFPIDPTFSKVAEVTVLFWIIKVLTTGMGESMSDYLVHRFVPAIAVIPVGIAFVAALLLQFSRSRYVVWIYWLAVAMVSVFGTMAADVLHVELGIPYVVSSLFFAVTLGVIFATWHRSEGTLSVHSINTRRREAFYWATVLTTFALGTAVGDWTAVTLHLGYFSSGVLFAALMAIPALGYWRFRMNAIFAFWFAYILTRPLGASFADWMGVSKARGGLGWGTGPVTVGLAILIVGFVSYLSISSPDAPEPVVRS